MDSVERPNEVDLEHVSATTDERGGKRNVCESKKNEKASRQTRLFILGDETSGGGPALSLTNMEFRF